MANRIEGEVRITGADAARRDLHGVLGEVHALRGGFDSFSSKLTAVNSTFMAATQAIGMVADAVSAVASAIADAGTEFERQAGILNRFTGDVDEAADRTNGLISRIDLMTASNRLAQAGLQLTGREFANISVAAIEFASATGGDAAAAIQSFGQAVATGADRPLKLLGISLTGITDVSERQQVALAALEERYGTVQSSADSFAGSILTLSTRLDDAQTEFIEAMDSSDGLRDAVQELISSFDDLFESIAGGATDGLSSVQTFALGVSSVLEVLIRRTSSMVEAFQQGPAAALQNLARLTSTPIGQEISDAMDANIAGFHSREPRAALKPRTKPSRPPRGGRSGRTEDDSDDAAISALGAEILAQQAAELQDIEDKQKAILDLERLRAEAERDALEAKEKTLALLEAEEAQRAKITQATKESADAERIRTLEAEKTARTQEVVGGLVEQSAQFAMDAARAAIEGEEGALKALAERVAIEETWAGAIDLITAAGLAILNPPAAASKAISGAGHLAMAGIAGAVAGAAPAAPPVPSAGAPSAGNVQPSAGGGGGGGTTVINFGAPVASEEVGRMQARADRAARRRFGRRS